MFEFFSESRQNLFSELPQRRLLTWQKKTTPGALRNHCQRDVGRTHEIDA